MVLGAVAGAAASLVMAQTTSYLDKQQNKRAREQQEKQARKGKTAYGIAAGSASSKVKQGGVSGLSSGGSVAVEKAASMVGQELSDEEHKKLELILDFGLSMGAGATYALLRRRIPAADWHHGLVFGLVFWLLVDEVGNTVLGLTPPPRKFPWQTHMRGLAGHLVFGLVTETVLEFTDSE
jgi:gas vesicle protein